MSDSLLPIRYAIQRGDKKGARELLRPLLQSPTAELWYLSAYACESHDHARQCLNRALVFDPKHMAAKRALHRLESGMGDLPPLDAPQVAEKPIPPVEKRLQKPVRRQRKRNPWVVVGCAGTVLLSLSSAYFVLTVLGAPITGQIRALLGGEGGQQGQGTPVFGAQPGGGNHFVVKPSKSAEIKRQQPISDVLDAGYTHEYTFDVRQGDELAVGIQFFSPNAKKVGANVAVLDADGVNAESRCQRESILSDGSSVAFICRVHKTGKWKLQVFGRDGESTGAYVVTYDRQ